MKRKRSPVPITPPLHDKTHYASGKALGFNLRKRSRILQEKEANNDHINQDLQKLWKTLNVEIQQQTEHIAQPTIKQVKMLV